MTDCFGNPTPGIPPSISDTFSDIQRYKSIPWAQRDAYHRARVDALIGRADPAIAWGKLRRIHLDLRLQAK